MDTIKRCFLSKEVQALLKFWGLKIRALEQLKGDGSSRKFFRLFLDNNISQILILPQEGSLGLKEARSYAYIGKYLFQQGISVPQIKAYDSRLGLLLVQDLGDRRLQDIPLEQATVYYEKVISLLVKFQESKTGFDTAYCLETPRYEGKIIWEKECLYFLSSFLKSYMGFSPPRELFAELRSLVLQAEEAFREEVLLHRDFQSRNIMIYNEMPFLIDFQGTRLGPPSYDLASLLWDPYTSLLEEQRSYLWKLYLDKSGWGEEKLEKEFKFSALFRLMQALGAFSKLFRKGKTWFAYYIRPALENLLFLIEKDFPKALFLKNIVQKSLTTLP